MTTQLLFSNPEYFFLLILIPILLLVQRMLYRIGKKHALLFANFDTLKRVRKNQRMRAHIILFILRLLALTALIISFTGPTLYYQTQAQPTDYVIAIDNSASMTANDLQPSRFEAAKTYALTLVEELQGSRIGLLTFSGYTQIQQILTQDTELLNTAIQNARVETLSGTDIAGSIITATNMHLQTEQGKALILITDGSPTTGQANTDSIGRALAYAEENELTIHAIGIGQTNAAPTGYLPLIYNVSAVYNTEELQRITTITNGVFIEAQTTQELLEALPRLLEESQSTNTSQELSIYLLYFVLVFILIDWLLINARLRIYP